MKLAEKLYAHMPVLAQHAVVSVYGLYWNRLRFGPGYRQLLAGYLERDRFTEDQWRTYTTAHLRALLSIAAAHVPYYRDHWSPQQKKAARAGRLAELPLLDKDPLRADPCAFVRHDARPKTHVFHTSGSTGTPIASIWTTLEYRSSLALREARSARWAGVSFNLPRATFSGRIVEPNPNSQGPFYRYNVIERQVYFSAFHLRKETARAYVEALHRHGTQWLTGYAVSYYLLAKFILEQSIVVPPLKAVVTTSEKLTPEMRHVMEEAFACRVYEEYSTVDNALFASECEHGGLHVSPDAGVVEILRPDGTPCQPEEEGHVVATCLMRDYQPVVRFRLGDVAAWSAEQCPCARAMPVLKEVCGRLEDVVIGPDGRQMVRFHGVFVNQPHIREGQIIQESLSRIRVKVVPTSGYNRADAQEVVNRVRQRLGAEVEVIVEEVVFIARTKAGKFQAVVSFLNKPQHDLSATVATIEVGDQSYGRCDP